MPNSIAQPGAVQLPGFSEERIVVLGGVETVIAGALDDPYFQIIDAQALALDPLAALIVEQVGDDSTVLDIGANVGLSTILLARRAGRVIAFEPSPPNANFLRYNLHRNGIANVEVIEAAVSSEAGSISFHVAQFGAGSHVVAAGHILSDGIPRIEVATVRLDDLDLPPVHFMKIDAEGHEPDVLAGARNLLARDRPLIHAEINVWCLSAFAGHSAGAFVRRLWQAFDVYDGNPDTRMSPKSDGYSFLHDAIVQTQGVADLLFRPKEHMAMPTLPELSWPEAALAALAKKDS